MFGDLYFVGQGPTRENSKCKITRSKRISPASTQFVGDLSGLVGTELNLKELEHFALWITADQKLTRRTVALFNLFSGGDAFSAQSVPMAVIHLIQEPR